jgi:ribose/xylose/arabinose/galactoside ABC-type transport system permease subunit
MKLLGPYGLLLALGVLSLAIALVRPQFLSAGNLINVVRQISINGILAIGVTFVLLTAGVDLSLGAVVALAGVVAAMCAQPDTFPVLVPIAAGIATGLACGAMNGVVVTKGRVAPFIATLGMMTAARGLALVLSGGRPVSGLGNTFTAIGRGSLAGIPYPVLILGGVALAAHLFLQRFRPGREIYAVGGNEEAAHLAGVAVHRIKLLAYSVSGAMAGLAGVVLAARITTGQPNAAFGYELDAIAAAVIGGTSLAGGIGSVGGTLLGALLIGVISNGLDLLNVPSYYQQIVKGLLIVGAVWLDMRGKRTRD